MLKRLVTINNECNILTDSMCGGVAETDISLGLWLRHMLRPGAQIYYYHIELKNKETCLRYSN